ncbi:MAG: PEP-CTERM sorting domain-containing protein [Kiritimatiellaeota bacterium]|nr:PEP-CTERM sorting domain-containing protein [Kiritimatiellota bacterium]
MKKMMMMVAAVLTAAGTANAGTIEWAVAGANGTYLAVLMQRIPQEDLYLDNTIDYDIYTGAPASIYADVYGAVDVLRLSTANFNVNDGTYDIASLGEFEHLNATHNFDGIWPGWFSWHPDDSFISSDNMFDGDSCDWCMVLFKVPNDWDGSESDLSGLTSIDYMAIGATRVIGPWNGGGADTVRVEFDHGALGNPLFTGTWTVPEPTSAMLLAAGCAALLLRRRRGPQGN